MTPEIENPRQATDPSCRPLGIGIYTPTYPGVTGPGGIGTYTRHLAHALSDLGHRVHVLTPGRQATCTRENSVTVHAVSTRLPLVDRLLPGAAGCHLVGEAMRRVVRRYNLGVVEFPNYEGTGAWFALRRRVPLVVRLHTSTAEELEITGRVPTRTDRWGVYRERVLARGADALVTHSESHRARMARELAVNPRVISLVPHGIPVDPGFVRPKPTDRGLTVVCLGRLEVRKGTLDLIRAIPEIVKDCAGVRFVFIGWDRPQCPGNRTHAQYVRDEYPPHIRDSVVFLGTLADADVRHWLQTADVYVGPALYESFGLGFVEAMRWGTPVVGTTAGAVPEVVTHGETGLLVPPKNPTELGRAVRTLLRNPDLRERLGRQGRRRAEEEFNSCRMAVRVAALYADVLRQWHATGPVRA